MIKQTICARQPFRASKPLTTPTHTLSLSKRVPRSLPKNPKSSSVCRRPALITASSTTATKSLKEWAPIIEAISQGDQTIMLRKGGVKEPTFKPASSTFLLFPTSFHTQASLLKPDAQAKYADQLAFDPKSQASLTFSCYAELTGVWTTMNPDVIRALDTLHVYAPDFLEARLRWRPSQPLTVLEMRAYRLPQPVVVPPTEDMWGCFSWVDIAHTPSLDDLKQGAVPVISDSVYVQKQEECRQQLVTLADVEQLPLP